MSPEPASINAILRENCRSRLYVRPILWTHDQLRYLGCEFVPKTLSSTGRKHGSGGRAAPKDGTIQPRNSERWEERVRYSSLLRRPSIPSCKRAGVEALLETYGLRSSRFDTTLPFLLGGQCVARIVTDGIFSVGSTDVLTYLHLDTMDSLRKKYVYGKPCQRVNGPVANLHHKTLCSIQPANTAEDPYIAAALIALAQRQRWQSKQTTSGSASDAQTPPPTSDESDASSKKASIFKVYLLAVPGARAQVIYLYKASIPSAFLDKFDTPSRFSPSDPVRILYYELPLYNPEKLLSRLPRVLGLTREQCQGSVPVHHARSPHGRLIRPQHTRVQEMTLGDDNKA